jgi:hypothetical protein
MGGVGTPEQDKEKKEEKRKKMKLSDDACVLERPGSIRGSRA